MYPRLFRYLRLQFRPDMLYQLDLDGEITREMTLQEFKKQDDVREVFQCFNRQMIKVRKGSGYVRCVVSEIHSRTLCVG